MLYRPPTPKGTAHMMVRVYTAWFRGWAYFRSAIHPKTLLHIFLAFFVGIGRTFSASVRFVSAASMPELLAANPVKHHEEVTRRVWVFFGGLLAYLTLLGYLYLRYREPLDYVLIAAHVILFIVIGRTDALMVKVQTARIAGESLIRTIVDDVTLTPSLRKEGFSSSINSAPAVLPSGKGYEVTVRVSGKGNPELLLASPEKVAHKLQKDRRTVFTYEVRGTDLIRILILRNDPWSEPPSANPLVLKPRPIDLWTADIDLGIRSDFTRFTKRLVEEGDGGGILIGGKPRAGKSVFISNLLVALMLDPTAGIHIVDGSAVDYAMIKSVCASYVGDHDMSDRELLEKAHDVVRKLKEEISRRKRILAKEGVSKLSPKLAHKYGLGTEWLIIDELAVITEDMMSTNKKAVLAFIEDLQFIVRGGPKYGVFSVLATQRPSDKSVPSAIRGLISFRIAFYIADQAGSASITGKAGPANRADLLDPEQKGVAIVVGEGRMRAHLVETFDLSRVAAFARTLRASSKPGTFHVKPEAVYPEPVATMLQIMDEKKVDAIRTSEMLDALRDLGHDRVTEKNLAESLKPLGVFPKRPYIDKAQVRGYLREDLESVSRVVYTASPADLEADGDTCRTGEEDGSKSQD
jgi:hypothetical protein